VVTPPEILVNDIAEATPAELSIRTWRDSLETETSVSAGTVQDRLLDMWADFPDGAAKKDVESWLSETLGRSLYMASDVRGRLDGLLVLAGVSAGT
jgi:hypothetical protein